jgi:hypothetical protein
MIHLSISFRKRKDCKLEIHEPFIMRCNILNISNAQIDFNFFKYIQLIYGSQLRYLQYIKNLEFYYQIL